MNDEDKIAYILIDLQTSRYSSEEEILEEIEEIKKLGEENQQVKDALEELQRNLIESRKLKDLLNEDE